MKLSFATLGCPNWTMEQVVANAKAMGFDGVELRGAPGEHIGPDEPVESRAKIRKMFADAKLEVACIMGYSFFTHQDPAKLKEAIENAIKFTAVAKDIGCPTLRVFAGKLEGMDREKGVKQIIDSAKQIVPAAEKNGIKLAIETHDDWCKGENLIRVIDGVGSRSLGVCWDIANAFWVEDLEKTHKLVKDHIYHVHFKDGAKGPDGKTHSTLPGTGSVDMLRGLKLLKSGGYNRWLSFEWEKKWEPELAEPEVAFPHYMKHVKKLLAQAGM